MHVISLNISDVFQIDNKNLFIGIDGWMIQFQNVLATSDKNEFQWNNTCAKKKKKNGFAL